jgi:subtilase family serine protease
MKLRSLLRLDVGAVSTRYSRSLGALAAAACLALAGTALASGSSSSTPLISGPINENNTVSIGSVPMQALQTVINGISDPHSSTYRQFLTSDEVAKFGPAETDIATVVTWRTEKNDFALR